MDVKTYHQVLVVEPSTQTPGAFVCRSKTWGIRVESADAEKAANFVKGATLSLLGGLWTEIPDEVHIRFEVDRSALSQRPLCDAKPPHSAGCADPSYECVCSRCQREPTADERFHACAMHRNEIAEEHYLVRGTGAIWKRQAEK